MSTNPFESSSGSGAGGGGSTNPFADDPAPTPAAASTNPFADDGPRQPPSAKMTTTTNPFESPAPPPPGAGSGSNPFDDDDGGGGGTSPRRGTMGLGGAMGGLFRSKTVANPSIATNPFDDDEDTGGAPSGSSDVDGVGDLPGRSGSNNGGGGGGVRHRRIQSDVDSSSGPGGGGGGGGGGSGAGGPGIAPLRLNRSKTVEAAADKLTGWLRRPGGGKGGRVADEGGGGGASGEYDSYGGEAYDKVATPGQSIKKKPKDGGKKGKGRSRKSSGPRGKAKIQSWPYDDYHKTQEQMYENLSLAGSQAGLVPYYDSDSDGYGSDGKGGDKKSSSSDQPGGAKKDKKPPQDQMRSSAGGEDRLYERPAELPTIAQAVQNLSLVDFERKAEERAISIVSTWLHDSGLIDELLITGTAAANEARAKADAAGKAAAKSSSPDSTAAAAEGIEVGVQGYPLHLEPFKMEKEIERLRRSTQRELTLVDSRLNDGVAASGAEVQELVDAVAATRGDLGTLRQMTSYITEGCRSDDDQFLLRNCPRLRKAINARRNLNRCFRELDFFDTMPATCERLREELHSGEWTTDEWNTIRNVSMEHVELEILLVEAEAGMKARLKEEEDVRQYNSDNAYGGGGSGGGGGSFRNYDAVDRFLSVHVKNVWELGDEIRMRILSGIGSSFDLALNNPAAMVALVEAVEVYERAAEEYAALLDDGKDSGGGGGSSANRTSLRFTDMRASALAQIYQDFELRGLEVFRNIHMRAADSTEEGNEINSQFSAVLRAATELVGDIGLVKDEMAPCFAPNWAIEVLWSSCVAHVCSNQILQQIGGPEGNNLPDLTVTQLLDLVAWIEFFREHIEEAFPHIAELKTSEKTYFDTRPDLFAGDGKKEVDMDSANDSLAWVKNMLWEVHRLAQSEFLQRTRDQTDEWLANVYNAKHTQNQTSEGRLTSSLCEDVFQLVGVQLRTIREHLSPSSEALVMAVCLVFSQLRIKQVHSRDNFLQDLESACAAANDFARMSEKCEDAIAELQRECEFTEDVRDTLEESASEMLALYSADAVYAAQSVHEFIFDPIQDAIADQLFGPEWEENLTHNELALTLVRTIEDFLGDLEEFLDDFLVKKTIDALVAATVVFYVQCLLEKAEKHASTKASCFQDPSVALERISGDIRIMREFFEGLVPRMPNLRRVIEKEFEFLTALHECMSIAAEVSASDLSDFIIVVHKMLNGNIGITKHFLGDLWHLVAPAQERAVWELIDSKENELEAIAPKSEEAIRQAMDRQQVPGLRLDRMMADLYLKSKRKLPIHSTALDNMVASLRLDWGRDDATDGRQPSR